jgi:uncharacterized protein
MMLAAQIYLDEDDQAEGRPAYEYILRYLMHHDIGGATLFRGEMGFGAQHHLHAPGRLGAMDDRPLLITFIDSAEKVRRAAADIRTVFPDGVIVLLPVDSIL